MNDSTGRSMAAAKNILVVDDSQSVSELIKEMLLSFGYQAEICLTVKDALDKFEAGKYDLVITDYTMPGMNGVEFAQILRQRAPTQTILLITGSAFSMGEATLRQLPVNTTLQKPFSVQEFHEVVAAQFGEARASA
jgi:CheY-like chemotaxis protein